MTYGIAGYRCLQEKLSLAATLELVRDSGAVAFEPLGLASDEDADRLGEGLTKHGLSLKSLYVNSKLHESDWEIGVENVLEQARRAKSIGAGLLVTNPQPIAWGQLFDKNDAQLENQRLALTALAKELGRNEMQLLYHVHDMELRNGARELHHMLLNVPEMAFCLDAHWLYRGCGNSRLAVDDFLTLYASRVLSVHVRQSAGGVCAETLDGSDIDWPKIARRLRELEFDGPVYVELLKETGTPETMPLTQAHSQSVRALKEWFCPPLPDDVFGRGRASES